MSTALKPRHQRLILLALAVATLIAAAMLAMWALRNRASYFYVPSELIAHPPAPDRTVRLGGMVEKGSIRQEGDGVTVDFVVTDYKKQVPVRFSGIRPALFVEGSGVVAEGHRGADGVFHADILLAKHDERYVPRELKDMTASQARRAVAETQ